MLVPKSDKYITKKLISRLETWYRNTKHISGIQNATLEKNRVKDFKTCHGAAVRRQRVPGRPARRARGPRGQPGAGAHAYRGPLRSPEQAYGGLFNK